MYDNSGMLLAACGAPFGVKLGGIAKRNTESHSWSFAHASGVNEFTIKHVPECIINLIC